MKYEGFFEQLNKKKIGLLREEQDIFIKNNYKYYSTSSNFNISRYVFPLSFVLSLFFFFFAYNTYINNNIDFTYISVLLGIYLIFFPYILKVFYYNTFLTNLILRKYFYYKSFLFDKNKDYSKATFFDFFFKIKKNILSRSQKVSFNIKDFHKIKKNSGGYDYCFDQVYGSFKNLSFNSGFYAHKIFLDTRTIHFESYYFFAFKIPFSFSKNFLIYNKKPLKNSINFEDIFDIVSSELNKDELLSYKDIKSKIISFYLKLPKKDLNIFTYNNWIFFIFKIGFFREYIVKTNFTPFYSAIYKPFFNFKLRSCLLRKNFIYEEDINNFAKNFESFLNLGVDIVENLKILTKKNQ